MRISRWLSRRRETRKKRRQGARTAALLIESRAKRIAMVAELEGIKPNELEDAIEVVAGSSALSTDQALSIAETVGLAGVQALVHGADDE